jgi:outer membrane protein TolC
VLLNFAAIAFTCVRCKAQISLATVVELAQHNSVAVRMAQADVNRAAAVYSERKDAFIPSSLISTGIPAFPGTGFTGTPPSIVTATVNSLVFGISQKRYVDAAGFELQAAGTRLKDVREQVALDASTAYLELDSVKLELSAAREEEVFSGRLVEIERERAEAGVDALHELLEAKLTDAQIKLKREHLETRAALLSKQLAALTGLPPGSIAPDHAGIPKIPEIRGDDPPRTPAVVESSRLLARSRQQVAKGDEEINYIPQVGFGAQDNVNTEVLNNANDYFLNGKGGTGLPKNNLSSRIAATIPIFDLAQRARARESAAEALCATVEAEQTEHQNDSAIAELASSLRELVVRAEIAGLEQQIAQQDLESVITRLEVGNGSGAGPNAISQASPKSEQIAHIRERAKLEDSLDVSFDLAKTRLRLLKALGHMEDWLHELDQR